jgi:hypothetical protein
MTPRGSLFEADVPDGFHYRDDFITRDEEARLAEEVAGLEFSNFEMRGVVARRRVAFFGRAYDSGTAVIGPLPAFLLPVRDRLARWAEVDPNTFEMAVVNEYFPGRADRLAPRRAAVRNRRGSVSAVSLPDEVSAVQFDTRPPADRHARDHARAAIGVSDDGRVEERLRAPHPGGDPASLFDHVPYGSLLSHGFRGFHIPPCR